MNSVATNLADASEVYTIPGAMKKTRTSNKGSRKDTNEMIQWVKILFYFIYIRR